MYKLHYHERRDALHLEDFADRVIYWIKYFWPETHDVLDIGAGKGYFVRKAREAGLNAYGVDLRNFNAPRVIIADARALPFQDNSFDFVNECYFFDDIAGLQEQLLSEVEKAVLEVRRVLRPRGILVATQGHLGIPNASKYFKMALIRDKEYEGVYEK